MFFASNISSKAQCTGNETQYTHNFTIGTCDYKIILCVDCSPTHQTTVRILEIEYDASQSGCMPPNATFWTIVNNEISDPDLYWNVFCQSVWGTVPCPQYLEYVIQWDYCFYYKKIEFESNEYIKIYPCDGSPYCEQTVETCFNPSPPPGFFTRNVISYQGPIGGDVECTYMFDDEEVDPDELEINETSDCWIRMDGACPTE